MCGFAGIYSPSLQKVSDGLILDLISPITRRGPDSAGVWSAPEHGIGLGHRRLSILDLSDAGHQPMFSHNKRYVIAFNGEIYNFGELKASLDKEFNILWKGHSDTEILVEYISHFGLSAALKEIVGMFAFALWDSFSKKLSLVRDRIGEKPLYYRISDGAVLFGSELSCIEKGAQSELFVDRQALSQLVRQGYICAPLSIYDGVFKVKPGECVTFDVTLHQNVERFWCLNDVAGESKSEFISDDELLGELEDLLSDSVKGQMLSDVPIGAFLSGGVDSSLISALMQKYSAQPIKTFSIGFDDPMYDEANFSRKVANHLGTEHHELYISAKEILTAVTEIQKMFSEPFGDSSQLPTYLVCKLAAEHVSVCLSGDGGDELFWGYSRYELTLKTWERLTGMSFCSKKALSKLHAFLPVSVLNLVGKIALRDPYFGDKVDKILTLLSVDEFTVFYSNFLMSSYREIEAIVIDGASGLPDTNVADAELNKLSKKEWMSIADIKGYLPDDILCKVDRCAMYNSLEARIPMLDHRVVEFAIRLPNEYKNRLSSKWPLRELLYKYVPKELIERPKKGFSVPLDIWLRRELKDWAEGLLEVSIVKQQGFFDHNKIGDLWREHQSGERNWSGVLWNILMFQQWLENRSK